MFGKHLEENLPNTSTLSKELPLYNVLGSNKLLHYSKDTKLFPFIYLCGICISNLEKSRFFYCPKEIFFHLYSKHMKKTEDFLDFKSKPKKSYDRGFFEELKTLEQISYANQRGLFTK